MPMQYVLEFLALAAVSFQGDEYVNSKARISFFKGLIIMNL